MFSNAYRCRAGLHAIFSRLDQVIPCFRFPCCAALGAGLVIFSALFSRVHGEYGPNSFAPVVEIHLDRILEHHFLGFGTQWEYEGGRRDLNVDNPIWEKRWPEMVKRIDFMRPSILRIMHDAKMYTKMENGQIVADYDSPRMELMYRLLDHAKSRNIPVLFGEWWLHEDYLKHYGTVTDPRWAEEVIVPFLIHLREERGYTNIRYFNLINEPHAKELLPGMPFDYEGWRSAVIHLGKALKKNGLGDKVIIAGTDGPGDWSGWLDRLSKDTELNAYVGAYEYHLYAHLRDSELQPSLVEGKLETHELRPRRLMVSRNDANGRSKPFFMGEAGIDDGNKEDQQTKRSEFSYGVWMADYAVQSMRAGLAGLIAWDTDDAMHTWGSYGQEGLKGWGFWNSLAGFKDYPADDFKLRPWFYTWSLLCRLLPQGAQTLEVDATGDPLLRVAAARLPDGKGFSLVIVNQSSEPRRLNLNMANAGQKKIHEFHYFEASRPTDEDGFPVASSVRESVNLESGLELMIPGQGVIFMTTQEQEK
jgi:hypothetical protein